jgi:hypothetical protein
MTRRHGDEFGLEIVLDNMIADFLGLGRGSSASHIRPSSSDSGHYLSCAGDGCRVLRHEWRSGDGDNVGHCGW